jgi:uncharacterized membrane protein
MVFLLIFHAALACVITVSLHYVFGQTEASAFAAGAGVSFLNLIFLALTWPRLLQKKQVALSTGVIVFKFAILGWIIYEVVARKLFHLGWFSAGLALVIVSTVVAALQYARRNSAGPTTSDQNI